MDNNYNDKNKQKEEQTAKDRFISMSAKGHSKNIIKLKLNLSEELFIKWSAELKDKVLLKSNEISNAKKARKSKRLNNKIKLLRKPFLVLIALFAVYSFITGAMNIQNKITIDAMSKCLSARAQLNFLTGQKLSLFPRGPVNIERTANTAQNTDALTKILIRCKRKGFTNEDSFTSVLFNTRQGKGDRIVDTAGILSVSDFKYIKKKLTELEKNKGAQLVVVTTYTVEPLTIELFANQLFNTWKIGRKNINDGVLFLIAKDDRQMRIEVGYGLEGTIPHITAKSILRDYVRPYFKAGRLSEGIKIGVNKIIAQINGENLPQPTVKLSILRFLDIKYFGPFCGVFAIVFLLLFLIILNYKGVLVIIAMMGINIFNYFFNIHTFHELTVIIFFLMIAFVILYWKMIRFTGKGWTGGQYRKNVYRTNYDPSSNSTSGTSGSSNPGFSGGGGESGGGGASDSW